MNKVYKLKIFAINDDRVFCKWEIKNGRKIVAKIYHYKVRNQFGAYLLETSGYGRECESLDECIQKFKEFHNLDNVNVV